MNLHLTLIVTSFLSCPNLVVSFAPTSVVRRSSYGSSSTYCSKRGLQLPLKESQTALHSLSSVVSAVSEARGVDTHYLVRILFLRCFSLLYSVVFMMALRQNKALIGDDGITPARNILDKIEEKGRRRRKVHDEWWQYQKTLGISEKSINNAESTVWGTFKSSKVGRWIGTVLNDSKWIQDIREFFLYRLDSMGRLCPSLLWFLSNKDRNTNIDKWLDRIAIAGLSTSVFIFILGSANVFLLSTLWILQRSLMTVGGPWYSFGWEVQLAELTFHAIFMAPLFSLAAVPYSTPVPKITVWAMRWFLFRIMIGAGLIKLRANDKKWKTLETMNYFYETQPVPNPLSRYFHKMPTLWHKFEVLVNHFVELLAPWLLILPFLNRKYRILGGIIQIVFQSVIILSGNLSFLNWLTMLPALYCFDDSFVSNLFPSGYVTNASIASYVHSVGISSRKSRQIINNLFGLLIATLSIPVIKNLMSKRQIMNGSFDPLRLVNTYGAFGTVQEERIELVFESSVCPDGPWREYEFKVKPGNIKRAPRFISPYHYRLDWLIWIASVSGGIERNTWMFDFLKQLLLQNKGVLNLIENDPWQKEGESPKYIRVLRYKYKYAKLGDEPYWEREYVGQYFPLHGYADIDTLTKLSVAL
jgi:lipase maturation factor 1